MKSARTQPPQSSRPRSKISKRRLWLFWFIATAVPVLLLFLVLEGILRLAGFGFPTTFFVTTQIDGRTYYVPNDRFGLRFFPPTIARTPFALRMPVEKSTNTFRIFLFGESAAQGDPDPTFGVSRYLEVLLRDRFPGTDFEVVCVAMTAINSHAILPIARECARLDGDLWVIYMGNNEIVGPYGGGTVFGPKSPPCSLVRASLAIKATRTGQWFDQMLERFGSRANSQKSWNGLSMFQEHLLRREDASRLRALQNFGDNLEGIIQAARKAHVPVVFSTVASNLKDCPPFASLHRQGLDEPLKVEWEKHFRAGVTHEQAGEMGLAIAFFTNAAAIDSEFAELHFRIAGCALALSNLAVAKLEFELARDFDALAFRADSAINQFIARAAAQHVRDGVVLVDAEELLATNSADGLLGEELFYEHVHLNFAGNYLLAKTFAEKIAGLLPAAIRARDVNQWATAEFCDGRLGVSPWERHRVWQANFSRVSEPPFTGQLNDVPRAKRYMAKLEQFRAQMTPEAREQTRARYREALDASPNDACLHGNYAQWLSDFGDLAAAVQEQQRVCELLPQSPGAFHRAGVLLARSSQMDEASLRFKHTLQLRPDYVPALNELGLILMNQQKFAEAEQNFRAAIKLNPGYAESYVNLGFVSQNASRMTEALAQYRLAARVQPDGPAAHFSRAVEFANEGRSGEAIKFFEVAVWMNPSFWQARYLLGVELAMAEKVEAAESQFAEVVRVRPDFAKAHLNLGVALGKRRKLNEALVEFQAALRLNPTNELARRSVEKIQSLQNQTP